MFEASSFFNLSAASLTAGREAVEDVGFAVMVVTSVSASAESEVASGFFVGVADSDVVVVDSVDVVVVDSVDFVVVVAVCSEPSSDLFWPLSACEGSELRRLLRRRRNGLTLAALFVYGKGERV